MFKIVNAALKSRLNLCIYPKYVRTFLTHAYYCDEIWEDRLNSPLLKKANLDLLYHELDQRFQKTRRITAVDVDIFANAVKDEAFVDEMLDLVYKLRLTQDTGNALDSTGHAVIRLLMKYEEKTGDLLRVVDDRLNYGIFLDAYTGNILMDKFWKSKNFVAGAIVGAQFMLQEDFSHPVIRSFALLHGYNFLKTPGEWPKVPPPEEPEEEIKVRVKYLRNPYDDEHFDLRDERRIVGKTLAFAAKNGKSDVEKSLRILGLGLFGNEELAKKEAQGVKLIKEIIDLLPEDSALKKELDQEFISEDVNKILERNVVESFSQISEKDIANQCAIYKEWENARVKALEEEKKKLQTAERLAEIEKMKESLKQKEQKLWFFENEENIELEIEDREAKAPKKKIQQQKIEEDYIPPEIR